jgi:hypothetical protein
MQIINHDWYLTSHISLTWKKFTERWASAKQLEQKNAHGAHCKHLYFASLAHVMQVWLLGMALHSMKVVSFEIRFLSQAAVAAFCFMLWGLGPLCYWSESSMLNIGDSPLASTRELAPASSTLVPGLAWLVSSPRLRAAELVIPHRTVWCLTTPRVDHWVNFSKGKPCHVCCAPRTGSTVHHVPASAVWNSITEGLLFLL